jgi:hypothetical protein
VQGIAHAHAGSCIRICKPAPYVLEHSCSRVKRGWLHAGINDFIRKQPAVNVANALEKIWRMGLDAGANVLAVAPLPSTGFK